MEKMRSHDLVALSLIDDLAKCRENLVGQLAFSLSQRACGSARTMDEVYILSHFTVEKLD